MDFVAKNAKAIVTFIITAVVQAIQDAVNSGQALPHDLTGWVRFVGVSLIAAGIVWVTGNKLDVNQVIKATQKLEPSEQATVARTTLTVLPDPISNKVVADYPNWVQ